MTASRNLPSHGITIYNPGILSKEALLSHFIARKPLLSLLVEDLRRKGSNQHHLLKGQRGMGKTTLLRRLAFAIEDDPQLAAVWLPLTFPEEQYNVRRLSDFYLNCIDALVDTLDRMGRAAEVKALDKAVTALENQDEHDRSKQALELLLGAADKQKRRLVLLVDNADQILEGLGSQESWALRELLQHEGRIRFIGASAAMLESTYDYGKPFYDLFRTHELRGLDEKETRSVLIHLAEVEHTPEVKRNVEADPARIRVLHLLAGGNPRTIVMLYDVLSRGAEGDVRAALEELLDRCTPLCKDRFEELPAQAQQVMDALAIHWHPISAGELAEKVRLDVNVVSAQLSRLENQGIVEKVSYEPATRTGFQVAERFFNMWYLMRASRRVRQRLLWLVEFLRVMYTSDELRESAAKHLREAGRLADGTQRERWAEVGFVYSQVVNDRAYQRAMESASIQALVEDSTQRGRLGGLFDLSGTDASLKEMIEWHTTAAEIRDTVGKVKVRWKDWDARRVALLIAGAPWLTVEQKRATASELHGKTPAGIQEIVRGLEKQEARLIRVIGDEEATRRLYEAIGSGHSKRIDDVDGAEAAATILGAPELVAIAWAVRTDLACEHGKAGEHLEALQKAASQLVSPPPYVLLCIGKAQWELRRFDEAEKAFRDAIDLDPKYAMPWNNLGNLLWEKLGRFEEAEAAYRKAIDLDPEYAMPWNNLGVLLMEELGRFKEAEAAYRKAINLDPKFAKPWANLAQLPNHAEWEHALRKAIDLDPMDAYPQYWLAFYRHQRNHQDDAETEAAARRAVELDPDNPDAHELLAVILAYRNQWDAAFESQQRVLTDARLSDRPYLFEMIKDVFRRAARMGHADRALALLERAELTDRLRPLYEALMAIAAGSTRHFRRVAPEVRKPAEQLFEELTGTSASDPIPTETAVPAKPRRPVARPKRRA